jgi:hypothetical protein
MGSHFSNTVAEIFLQYLENTHLKQILETKTMFYTRHVDDMLMIYNAKHTKPETIHNLIKKTHPNLQFTPTHEHKTYHTPNNPQPHKKDTPQPTVHTHPRTQNIPHPKQSTTS